MAAPPPAAAAEDEEVVVEVEEVVVVEEEEATPPPAAKPKKRPSDRPLKPPPAPSAEVAVGDDDDGDGGGGDDGGDWRRRPSLPAPPRDPWGNDERPIGGKAHPASRASLARRASADAEGPAGEEDEPPTIDDGHVMDDAEDAARLERRAKAGRFSSISEEISALEAGLISEPSTTKAVDDRVACSCCGRKFAPDRLAKHAAVCQKAKKRASDRGKFSGDGGGVSGSVVRRAK